MEGEDVDAIKKTQDKVMAVSHKLAEAMYAKTSGGQGGMGPVPVVERSNKVAATGFRQKR